jgi:hypothetical protein
VSFALFYIADVTYFGDSTRIVSVAIVIIFAKQQCSVQQDKYEVKTIHELILMH